MSAKKTKPTAVAVVHATKARKRKAHSKHAAQSKQTFFTGGRCR